MTHDELIEAAARVIKDELRERLNARPITEWYPDSWSATGNVIDLTDLTRSVAPILLEAGAKMMQDAAADFLERETQYWPDPAFGSLLAYVQHIRQLDPAEVVKEASK